MRFFRDPLFGIPICIAIVGTVTAIGAVLIGFNERPIADRVQVQQKRYVISRPERCAEIINGGLDRGEYLFCKTPEGHSLFYKSFDAKNWGERQYK